MEFVIISFSEGLVPRLVSNPLEHKEWQSRESGTETKSGMGKQKLSTESFDKC